MGGSVSAGRNNDELIDHLVEAEFIKTPSVQRIFRAVDRGNYYDSNQKQDAYKDSAWKMGNLHLSAPCVYSAVLEALKLKAGLSFLNLGSGSGYLSTMAGLILGPYGINHGIELYSDIVDFAYDRLDDFMKNSKAVDEYDFCQPTFTVGNCLSLDGFQQYDRVYCGAACPQEYEPYIKGLVKVGGILIMPINQKLLKITRTSETRWHSAKVLAVTFTPLISPPNCKGPVTHIKLGDHTPPKLQQICHATIRAILRKNMETEYPNLKIKQQKRFFQPIRPIRRIVIPFYNDSDLNSQSNSEFEYDSDGPEYTVSSRLPSHMSMFVEDFLRRHAELNLLREIEANESESEEELPILDVPLVPPPQNQSLPLISHVEVPNAPSPDDFSSDDDELFSLITLSNMQERLSNIAYYSASDDDIADFDRPPSQCTRNRKKCKRKNVKTKRKRPTSDKSEPSTSSSNRRSPRKRVKRCPTNAVWKKYSDSKKGSAVKTKNEFDSDDENYPGLMAQKIAALPLPILLMRYLNYRRSNL